jgi:hypothetical protein
MSATQTEIRSRIDRLLEVDPVDRRAFLGTQYDLGLAWVHFPEGSGGLARPRARRPGPTRRPDASVGSRQVIENGSAGIGHAEWLICDRLESR